MEGGAKGKVCVTGGTGFLGSWLVKKLLEDGYSVHTTVRPDPEKKRDYSFLTNLPGASERLQIYPADLDEPESFGPAIEGCVGVFHLANSGHGDKDPIETVVKRTVDGTLGILKACLNAKTVKRVVYTSSASCMMFTKDEVEVLDESCWSDVDVINAQVPFLRSYPLSKTLAEKAALEFSEQHGLEVVTVIPTIISGPFICPKLPSSVGRTLAPVFGTKALYAFLLNFNMVHVDDAARAHIFLFEHPNANGRYVCSSHKMTLEELVKFYSDKYPEFEMPSLESLKDVKSYVKDRTHMISSKKLLDAGFEYKHGIEEILDGAIQSCKEKGYLKPS